MKEHDLKQCFCKVRPSERLITDTIRVIDDERALEERRARFSFGFSYRLASAMCALLVVIGLSVAVIFNPALIPTASEEGDGASAMPISSGRNAGDVDGEVRAICADLDVIDNMTATAIAEGGEYAVFVGSLDGCYFGGVTPEEAEAGVIYRCTLTFTALEGDVVSNGGADLPYDSESGSLHADVYVYDTETMRMILDSSDVYVRLRVTDGKWTVAELISASAE